MVGGGELKVATVEVESVDNMATLPVSRAHGGSDSIAEKNNAANKEMELKKVQPKPDKRYNVISIVNCALVREEKAYSFSLYLKT